MSDDDGNDNYLSLTARNQQGVTDRGHKRKSLEPGCHVDKNEGVKSRLAEWLTEGKRKWAKKEKDPKCGPLRAPSPIIPPRRDTKTHGGRRAAIYVGIA